MDHIIIGFQSRDTISSTCGPHFNLKIACITMHLANFKFTLGTSGRLHKVWNLTVVSKKCEDINMSQHFIAINDSNCLKFNLITFCDISWQYNNVTMLTSSSNVHFLNTAALGEYAFSPFTSFSPSFGLLISFPLFEIELHSDILFFVTRGTFFIHTP